MDSLNVETFSTKAHDLKTVNAAGKESFNSAVNYPEMPATSATAFARETYKTGDATRPSVRTSSHNMGVSVAFSKRDPAAIGTALQSSVTARRSQYTEPSLKHLIRDKAAAESSDLPAIDKSLIDSSKVVKTVLLQSYRFSPNLPTIARPVHGLQHSCRTAIWALSVLQLRKQQHDPQALAFPDDMVPLLIKACLFHDSGRQGDGKDTVEWEQASADNLREHLRNCGIEQSLAWQCGEAICNKDNPDACQHLPEQIQTLRSLLHDADTLEVMRVRARFYMDRLECFTACRDDKQRKNYRALAAEVGKVIARQGDLWVPIALHDSEASDEKFFSINTAGLREDIKKQWEHHPSPLWYQLFSIGKQSDFIRGLITPYAGEYLTEPPDSSFSLATLNPHKTGLYNDPVNQQFYAVKETSCELSACNQVLMANLARLLGITVPECFVHQERGCFYVVSQVASEWAGNLRGGQEALQSLSSEQWARLMLVNVIVGNESMVNSAWEGIELTPEGEPVMCHWDFAGLATRYLTRDGAGEAPGTDDFSAMPVLLKKLRDPRAPVMNSFPVKNPCVDILAQLDDDFLGHTLQKILSQLDWQALDRLIEHSGFLPGDRSWLRQTIHDRIAWLTTRFPNSLAEGERVSIAEYKAIEAAGIRGGWLPVKGQDIRGGQICISQLLDANGQPITRMSLRLSPSAGDNLADNLALERGLHHLANKVQYINHALNGKYRDWRSDLTSLADECHALARHLSKDEERWHNNDRDTINKTVTTLQDIVKKCRVSLTADQPSIEPLPKISHPLPVPVFPARVSSRVNEEAEAKVQLAQFSRGFTRLTGRSISYFNERQLLESELTASPVRKVEFKTTVREGGSILFFPPNLPNALTFEHKLIITLAGHSKDVVEALFLELAGLGIHGERPTTGDLEEQWLDALADYHGCLGKMNRAAEANDKSLTNSSKKTFLKQQLQLSDDALLDWEVHCRIRAGRLVHYLPGLPHGIMANPAREFCLGHNINFVADQHRETGQILIDSLNNECAMVSYGRRTHIGMKPFGNDGGMPLRIKYDANYVFSRLMPVNQQEDKQGGEFRRKYTGAMAMMFKSEALGRLDGGVYANLDQLNQPFPELDAFARNQKIIAKSADDYQRVLRGNRMQETHFSNPLSLLDELNIIQVGSAKDQYHLLQMLKQRYSHWPDGRPLEQLFHQSWLTCYYELTCGSSKVDRDIKYLIQLCGEDGIQLLLEQNPQLLQGKLESLDGMTLDGQEGVICRFDLTGCSMNGTVFKSVHFVDCKIRTEQLSNVTVEEVSFVECSFEGERLSLTILDNACFQPDRDNSRQEPSDKTKQQSRLIYQSCVNEQNEFNLNQWLTVMVKSKFLRSGLTPLDDLSQDILSRQIDTIIRDHPHKLCESIEAILRIQLVNTGCAINFIRNNPQFYNHIINDVRDLYFDFRTSFLSNEDAWKARENLRKNIFFFNSNLYKNTPREAILELIINSINFVLFPLHDNEYIEFGINYSGVNDNNNCRKSTSGQESTNTKNNPASGPDLFDLDFNRAAFLLKIRQCQCFIDKFWKDCSEENQLTIAKYCLSHHIVAVGHPATIEFMRLLTRNQEQSRWQADFAMNMKKHKASQQACNLLLEKRYGAGIRDNTVIDDSLPQ